MLFSRSKCCNFITIVQPIYSISPDLQYTYHLQKGPNYYVGWVTFNLTLGYCWGSVVSCAFSYTGFPSVSREPLAPLVHTTLVHYPFSIAKDLSVASIFPSVFQCFSLHPPPLHPTSSSQLMIKIKIAVLRRLPQDIILVTAKQYLPQN